MTETGVDGLLRRMLGERADEFVVETLASTTTTGTTHQPTSSGDDPAKTGDDVFEVGYDAATGRVRLAGNSPVAQASALRAYLREWCGTQVTVDDDEPQLPDRLPEPTPIRREAAFEHRYFFNVVTYAYTMVWWDWPRWERQLDWLALHGVNRPLIMAGHEAIVQRAFRDLGRDRSIEGLDEEATRASFLTGPAYLPFVHMGCLAGWDGPMPQAWIDQHADLAASIVARCRELGMTPVLPAFAGHVPKALAEVASAEPTTWMDFTAYALDPQDPLFSELSERYIAAQRELFGGTDHFYAADPFIEAVPPAQTLDEVAATAQAVYEGMRRGDPDAVWVFQSWPFTYREDYWSADRVQAFLGAVPDERMLILDLWSEHRPITAGLGTNKPWVWCMLHNFGGRPGPYGKLHRLATEPASSGAVGLGTSMEDFVNDPVVYELYGDVVWLGTIDLDTWVDGWVDARYGGTDDQARASLRRAWSCLRETVYSTEAPGPPGAVMLRRPRVDGELVPPPWRKTEAPRLTEVPPQLWIAWESLAEAIDRVDGPLARGPAGRDLADVAYLVVSTLGNQAQEEAARAYLAGDEAAFAEASRRFLTSIDDLERLLATRPEYLLGRWLTSARRWGETEAERAQYEVDARRLLTVWGPPDGRLVDYARRGWAGLVGSFYLHRWRRWVDELAESLSHRTGVDQESFLAGMRTFEMSWVTGSDPYPTQPSGNTAEVAAELHDRWR